MTAAANPGLPDDTNYAPNSDAGSAFIPMNVKLVWVLGRERASAGADEWLSTGNTSLLPL